MKVLIYGGILLSLFLQSCSTTKKRNEIITREVSYLEVPKTNFSSYGKIEMQSFKLTDEVKANEKKMIYAGRLETSIKSKMDQLSNAWSDSKKPSLIVEPEILELRIVSGGARFFVGALAGDSHIKLKLNIKDGKTNKVIAAPVIDKESGAMAGGWSTGSTDKNLVGYIADITESYFQKHYSKQ